MAEVIAEIPLKGRRTPVLSANPEHADPPEESTGEFYVPAHDAQGHSVNMSARCPPQVKSQIALMIASRRFPWQTDSEFVRWCIYRGLRYVGDLNRDDKLSNLQVLFNATVRTAQVQNEFMAYRSVVEQVAATIKELLFCGATEKAKEMIRECYSHAHRMDDDFWRKRYTQDIEQRFSDLLPVAVRKRIRHGAWVKRHRG